MGDTLGYLLLLAVIALIVRVYTQSCSLKVQETELVKLRRRPTALEAAFAKCFRLQRLLNEIAPEFQKAEVRAETRALRDDAALRLKAIIDRALSCTNALTMPQWCEHDEQHLTAIEADAQRALLAALKDQRSATAAQTAIAAAEKAIAQSSGEQAEAKRILGLAKQLLDSQCYAAAEKEARRVLTILGAA